MGIKKLKPTSPGRRGMSVADFSEITTSKPLKSLCVGKKNISGRNNNGRITVRHKGGGHKRVYRIIDFKRNKFDIQGKVASVEYDPNRSSRICLINYPDGEKRYIIAPKNLGVGDVVISSQSEVNIKTGNATLLKNIPFGTQVHNIELKPGNGGKIARSAGSSATLVGFEGKYAMVKLKSNETRLILSNSLATIGEVGNSEHSLIKIGKAGRSRWLNKRPTVRGTVMNPVDHPHGGGEGRSKGGKHPVTPWGKPTKGAKTRHNKRTSKFILSRSK